MKHVSLIGTVHNEAGFANATALVKILERIKPEVLFLEVPPSAFADHLTREGLESAAVGRYRANRQVDLVPVDLPTPEAAFFRDNQELHERIERRSPDFCRLMDRHSQYVRAYGFAYLNSDHCSRHWLNLHGAMRATLDELADRRLFDLYEEWVKTNELRDRHMLMTIADYCTTHTFHNGVFLVGAAHRQSLIEKSRVHARSASPSVQWDFAGFLEAPTT